MKLPVEITFRNLHPSAILQDNVRARVRKLEQACDRLTGCRVLVEAAHRHQHQGRLYHVRIELSVPGRALAVSRDPAAHQAHADVYVAVRDAFAAARRQLERFRQVNRRAAQAHAHAATRAPRGRILELQPLLDCGRIGSAGGREIYFHRNSLLNGRFDRLEVGAPVRFAEERGDQGPQASSVRLL
jgi:ribosome-associated translation inhibitor RaiA/cold shock CspA family protein